MNMFRQRLVVGAISMLALLVAACGSTSGTAAASSTPTPTATAMASPTPTTAPSGMVFTLTGEAQGVGVVNGTATIILGDNSFRVIVVMTGLAPNSTHPSHIHTGSSCTANGSVAYALQSVVADANGNASAISTVPVAYAVPATGWYVNVHEGPTLDGAGGTPIACTLLN